jgi:hypothetical protein
MQISVNQIWKLRFKPLGAFSDRVHKSPGHLRSIASLMLPAVALPVIQSRALRYRKAGCPANSAIPTVIEELVSLT